MKHKIYIVQQSVEVFGDVRQQMVRAFVCRRTAKKFIDYQNIKLAELKSSFENLDLEALQKSQSKANEAKLRRLLDAYSTNEYFLKEVDLHH